MAKIALFWVILLLLSAKGLAISIPLRISLRTDSVSISLNFKGLQLSASFRDSRISLSEYCEIGAFSLNHSDYWEEESIQSRSSIALRLKPRQNLSLYLRYTDALSGGLEWKISESWSARLGAFQQRTDLSLVFSTDLGDLFHFEEKAVVEKPIEWSEFTKDGEGGEN